MRANPPHLWPTQKMFSITHLDRATAAVPSDRIVEYAWFRVVADNGQGPVYPAVRADLGLCLPIILERPGDYGFSVNAASLFSVDAFGPKRESSTSNSPAKFGRDSRYTALRWLIPFRLRLMALRFIVVSAVIRITCRHGRKHKLCHYFSMVCSFRLTAHSFWLASGSQ